MIKKNDDYPEDAPKGIRKNQRFRNLQTDITSTFMEQLFQKVKGLKTQNTSEIDQKADENCKSDESSS